MSSECLEEMGASEYSGALCILERFETLDALEYSRALHVLERLSRVVKFFERWHMDLQGFAHAIFEMSLHSCTCFCTRVGLDVGRH